MCMHASYLYRSNAGGCWKRAFALRARRHDKHAERAGAFSGSTELNDHAEGQSRCISSRRESVLHISTHFSSALNSDTCQIAAGDRESHGLKGVEILFFCSKKLLRPTSCTDLLL